MVLVKVKPTGFWKQGLRALIRRFPMQPLFMLRGWKCKWLKLISVQTFYLLNLDYPPLNRLFRSTTVFPAGLAALIQTQQTVLAAVGEDAPLSCLLLETKDVQQVTWQKDLGNTERSICSYSEYFNQTVNPDFEDKVQFTEAGLQNNSIVIRNVTEQDEGCYLCLFNTFSAGALTGRTCLKVYELHGPVLNVCRSSSPAGSDVSCSATGRPAPTVTLTAPQQNLSLSLYNTTRVSNSNGTVTVTTTALLSASSSTQVGCSVSVLSAAPRELLLTVPGPSERSDHGLDERSGSSGRDRRALIISVMVFFIGIGIFILKKTSQKAGQIISVG
uniref:OX-2 membrane glycoprotein-like n=1 Tax=Fundulus heteroclitus TaxID=8078 RepID=A0A3Q2PKW9_FUNHE